MTVTPTFTMAGSIKAGTAEHRLVSVATELDVDTDAPPATTRLLVEQAERMCFVLDALQRPHEVVRTVRVAGEDRES